MRNCVQHRPFFLVFAVFLLATLSALIPAAAQGDGVGSISGHVYEADGRTPILGVWVSASDYYTNQQMYYAQTAADGSYKIYGLPSGQYRVNAWVWGHVCKFWQDTPWYSMATHVPVTAPNDMDNINFSLGPGGTISGQVKNQASDSPLPNISVDAVPVVGGGGSGATTDQNGNYIVLGLPFGQYRVSSPSSGRRGDNDDDYVSEFYDNELDWNKACLVTISNQNPGAANINFSLEKGWTISGVVNDEQGNHIANLGVCAIDYATHGAMPGPNTGQDGSYTLVVPAGKYLVRACPSWSNGLLPYADELYNDTYYYNLAIPVLVQVEQKIKDINFSLAPGGTISGTVKDQTTGLPLAGVSVDAMEPYGGGIAFTDQNGNYTIAGLHFGAYAIYAPSLTRVGTGDDSYVQQVYNNKSNYLNANLVPISSIAPNATGIDFNLVMGTWSISGTVKDATTHQLITSFLGSVAITDPTVPQYYWRQTNIDTNGHYAIYGDSEGEYKLVASVPDYVAQWYNGHPYMIDADTITVGPDDNLTINFSLDHGAGSISGTVRRADGVKPLPNAIVLAYTADTGLQAGGGLANTNANGEYIINSLLPGDYKVMATSNNLSEWYQDKPSIDQADTVTVAALPKTAGIDITFDPWLEAPITGVKTETVTDNTVDAKTEAGTEVTVTGTAIVTAAQYASTPGSGFGGDIGKYIDVHIDDTTNVTQVEIRMYYTDNDIAGKVESSLRLYWWNETLGWVLCSESGVNTTDIPGYSGYIWAKIRADTTPDLTYLSGGPFGGGGMSVGTVGGIAEYLVGSSKSSSPPYAVIIGGAMAALAALALGGWFARRRWLGWCP